MLTNLEIKNGVMTPKYDIYNDNYTVTIKDDVTTLDIYYELASDNVEISIAGNENIYSDKGIGITLIDGINQRLIKLNVIKEDTETAATLKDYFTSLEVNKTKEMADFIPPLIGGTCFLIIIVIFSLLFHKRKKL